MKFLRLGIVLAIALMGTLLAMPVTAQDATPVASPMAEPAEEESQPVTTTVADGVITFTVVERPVSDAVIDFGLPGDSIGDQLVFSNRLFDESNTTKVGVDQGSCLRARPIVGVWECTWTSIFSVGSLVVQGPFYDNQETSLLAITGGTGDFAGASGQMTLSTTPDGNFQFTFEFRLPAAA